MDDFSPRMRIVKRVAQSFDITQQLRRIKDLVRLRQPHFGKRRSVHILHRYGSRIVVPLKVVDPNDVGVRQVQTKLGLPFESLKRRLIVAQGFWKQFDCY